MTTFAIAIDEEAAHAENERGVQLLAQRNYLGACEAFRRATRLDFEHPVYWGNLATALAYLMRTDDAWSAALVALGLDARNASALMVCVQVSLRRREYASALEWAERLVHLYPTNPLAVRYLAFALLLNGQLAAASFIFERAWHLASIDGRRLLPRSQITTPNGG